MIWCTTCRFSRWRPTGLRLARGSLWAWVIPDRSRQPRQTLRTPLRYFAVRVVCWLGNSWAEVASGRGGGSWEWRVRGGVAAPRVCGGGVERLSGRLRRKCLNGALIKGRI